MIATTNIFQLKEACEIVGKLSMPLYRFGLLHMQPQDKSYGDSISSHGTSSRSYFSLASMPQHMTSYPKATVPTS